MSYKKPTKKEIEKLDEGSRIGLAKYHYSLFPAATKVYIALKTGLDISFISKHWNEISGANVDQPSPLVKEIEQVDRGVQGARDILIRIIEDRLRDIEKERAELTATLRIFK